MLQIPTDNLYKFCALTGVVICAGAIVFIWTQVTTLTSEQDELQTQIAVDATEGESLQTEIHRLMVLVGMKEPETIPEKYAGRETRTIEYSDEEIKAMLREIVQKQQQLAVKSAQRLAKSKNLTDLSDRIYWLFYVVVPFELIGASMAFFGFYRWYYRIQLPQDQLVAAQLRESSPKTDDSAS